MLVCERVLVMEQEASKQKFAVASSLYLEGRYEEALVLLDELSKQHPGVFNIQYPMLQCLQRLERLEEVKEYHAQMVSLCTKERHREKLAAVADWITNMERQSSLGTVGLELDVDPNALNLDTLGDLFEPSTLKKRSSSSSIRAGSAPNTPRKVVMVVVVVALAVAGYVFLPKLLGGATQFSADIVLGLPYANLEGRFYRKSTDTSRTEMMGKVIITREGLLYTIIPEVKKYSVASLADVAGQSVLAEMSDFKKWINANGGKHTGQETLYGLTCDVYEAKVRMSVAIPPVDTKIWYAKKLAFPVKSESITDGPVGKVVMFLKNIKVEQLSDNLFDIPLDYAKVDAEELRGMGMPSVIGAAPNIQPRGMSNVPDNTKNMNPEEMKRLLQQFNVKQ